MPYLSLRGVTIPNDGYVQVSNIGDGDTGLHCNTDRSDCCRSSDNPPSGPAQGQWYLPDGTQVMSYTNEQSMDSTINFFSRNRDDGLVRLNRFGTPPQTDRGRFRCEIPNAAGVLVNLSVNIGEWFVS